MSSLEDDYRDRETATAAKKLSPDGYYNPRVMFLLEVTPTLLQAIKANPPGPGGYAWLEIEGRETLAFPLTHDVSDHVDYVGYEDNYYLLHDGRLAVVRYPGSLRANELPPRVLNLRPIPRLLADEEYDRQGLIRPDNLHQLGNDIVTHASWIYGIPQGTVRQRWREQWDSLSR